MDFRGACGAFLDPRGPLLGDMADKKPRQSNELKVVSCSDRQHHPPAGHQQKFFEQTQRASCINRRKWDPSGAKTTHFCVRKHRSAEWAWGGGKTEGAGGGGGAKVVAHVVARGSVEFARLETRSSCSNSNLDIVDGQAVKVVLSPLVAAHGALIEQ